MSDGQRHSHHLNSEKVTKPFNLLVLSRTRDLGIAPSMCSHCAGHFKQMLAPVILISVPRSGNHNHLFTNGASIEIDRLAQGHAASKWNSQDSNFMDAQYFKSPDALNYRCAVTQFTDTSRCRARGKPTLVLSLTLAYCANMIILSLCHDLNKEGNLTPNSTILIPGWVSSTF